MNLHVNDGHQVHEPQNEEEDKAEYGEPLHGELQQGHSGWVGFCWGRGHGGSGSSRRARRTWGELMAGARRDGSDKLGFAEAEAGLRAGVQ